MATLPHHVKSWMWSCIAESEARIERKMEIMMDQKVQVIHKFVDEFELRVLTCTSPITDISSIQTKLYSL